MRKIPVLLLFFYSNQCSSPCSPLVGFTPEVSEMKTNLKTLYASGGGDGPEAVTAALYAVTEMVSNIIVVLSIVQQNRC